MSTDDASVMVGRDNGLVARLREHIPHLISSCYIAHREALAVKDAATASPDFDMVDLVIRTLADLLGRSCVWSQRFKYLQRAIHNTNLEVQGIHTVRWLSRGEAVRRLCKVLGAAIILFHEYGHELYEVVICYKFQFCLYFLADVLGVMNELNLKFQKREVDVTEVTKDIDEATGDLRHRYLECGEVFGGGVEGTWLSAFLAVYGRGGSKRVKVRGIDGNPVTHTYTMHEKQIDGHAFHSKYPDCERLCTQFTKDTISFLKTRMLDLNNLAPTKLFRVSKWPRMKQQREKKLKEYLHGCSALFDNRLSGFALQATQKVLVTWAPQMLSHHADEGFHQGLTNYLGSTESTLRALSCRLAQWSVNEASRGRTSSSHGCGVRCAMRASSS
ncbi:hypothetical protein CLOP_g17150 [Closterium sp. NIES-67]|nr:hypothetical protein CLOP_g17150 [Closterium sp. NIES-67]